MYFYMKGKNRYLDLSGDFILSHNDVLVKTRKLSASPKAVYNASYVLNVKSLSFVARIVVTFKIIAFIWGRNTALIPEDTALKKPYVRSNDD